MNFYMVGDFSPSAHGEGLKKKKKQSAIFGGLTILPLMTFTSKNQNKMTKANSYDFKQNTDDGANQNI